METSIPKTVDTCNHDTDPEYLIIHCPRITQRAKWDDWAIEAATFLSMHGWQIRRVGPDMHAVPNMMAGAA